MKQTITLFISIIFVLSSIILITNAQTGNKSFTMKDQLNLNVARTPVISPDGSKVLFTIRSADLNLSKWITQIYMLNTGSGKYFQFTTNGESCIDPNFSPDQKWITFISGREYFNRETNSLESNALQLWSAPSDGGEAINWTFLPTDIEEYAWSNDSKKIAILSEEYNEEKAEQKEKNKKHKMDEEVFPKTKPNKVLHIFDVNSKKIVSTYTLDAGALNIKFNSAGDEVVYQTNKTGEYDDEQKYDVYSINLEGKTTQLTSAKGPETSPAFSPDDSHIAYISQTVPDIEFAETDLNIMNPGGNSIKNLTKDFNYSVAEFIWQDKNTILFTVKERTDQQLYLVDVSSGYIKKLSSGNMVISGLSLSKDGKLCYTADSGNTLPEIFVDGNKVSDFTKQLDQYNLGTQEVITYKSSDGKYDIDGILFKPAGFDSNKKYPFILTVHGGPYGAFHNTFLQYYGIKVFNDNGYLVFAPNPRGGSNYSDEFSQSARYDLGGNDYNDIMTGVDKIISMGIVDTSRMGVTGGSYGGYLTNWIISQTNRFNAAVSMYGIFSFFTDWSNSWQPSFEKMYFGYYYWEKPINMQNLYVNRSPAFYVQNISTPTLILQGAKDVYTDISNSREMYQALHARKIPVEFVVYPRAGHGIRNEPNQYLNLVHRALSWFEKYIPVK